MNLPRPEAQLPQQHTKADKPAQLQAIGCPIDLDEQGSLIVPVSPKFYPGPDSDFAEPDAALIERLERLHAIAQTRERLTFVFVRPNGSQRGYQVPVEPRDLKMNQGKFLR